MKGYETDVLEGAVYDEDLRYKEWIRPYEKMEIEQLGTTAPLDENISWYIKVKRKYSGQNMGYIKNVLITKRNYWQFERIGVDRYEIKSYQFSINSILDV